MLNHLRAVFDSNVYVAATLSHNPTSPTRELLERLKERHYVLLTCDAIVDEVVENLADQAVAAEAIAQLIARLEKFAEWVAVPPAAIEALLEDPDDNVVVACAVLGQAHYLVTYDPHFSPLGAEHRGIKIVKALPFLWAVRGDAPPNLATG